MAVVSVLWHSQRLRGAEHCSLAPITGGHRLSGMAVLPIDGLPGRVGYQVDVDERWRTRAVELTRLVPEGEHRMSMRADGEGHWMVDGLAAPTLDGCLDVDLGFSPCTNTLPIRRLALADGDVAQIRAAWVRFPGFTVEACQQSYERLDERRWVYRSGTFSAELTVAPSGLVVEYGGVWTAAAGPSPSPATGDAPPPGSS